MIGSFPDPYPDELLYSVCARYAERVNYPNKHMAIKDLFGKRGLSAIVDFPTRLEYLLSVIPHHNYSTDEIINKNTLFPFYESFLFRERALEIRKEMKSITANHLKTRLATNIYQVKMPEFLRFCPLCLVKDKKLYGETYWHRIHQLAGILVCPEHKCFLHDSPIRWERESSYLFHSANKLLSEKKPRFIDEKEFSHQIYIDLALEAKWLLSQENISLNQGELRERYYNFLLKKGFAFFNGKIRSSKLIEAFIQFYDPKLLRELGCPLEYSRKTWLPKLIDKTYANVLYHPIRHLLLLKFLSITAKQIFTEFVEFRPFQPPPYPCLNVASSHYKDLRVYKYQIFDNLSKKNKVHRPVAIFTCDCGFSYQRAGPDSNPNDNFKYDFVRNYGDVWESKLAHDWSNLDLSLAEIARRFETSACLITRHAIRLDLPINTEGTRKAEGYARYQNPDLYLEKRLTENRQKWLNLIREHSKLSRRELCNKFPTLYLWLQKNDSLWFENHLPKFQRVYRKTDILKWEEIDNELFEKVQDICEEIRNESKLARVSITEIIRRVGYKTWLDKRHLKLPRTSQLITEKLETLEDFMLRKIELATNHYLEKEEIPSPSQFIRKAIINNTTTHNSYKIQKAIDKSVIKIKMLISQQKK